MDPIWLGIAFILGYLARTVGLPTLVGYLAAGFVLNFLGVEGGEILDNIADLGVYLLLFSIGLKLNLKSLTRPLIWATASFGMILMVVLFGMFIFLLSIAGLAYLEEVSMFTIGLIAFGLSFSSTVFGVKVLEEKGAMSSLHGRVAIGILVIQDIIAVTFLSFTKGDPPSPWALALIGLISIPFLLNTSQGSKLFEKAGHGELLIVLGIFLPLAGAAIFDVVNLKPDLGALVMGILFSYHPRAKEMSDSLLNLKNVLLIGFFLTIGLLGTPNLQMLGLALLFVLLLPLKSFIFFVIQTRFRMLGRASLLSSSSLTNFSEFGLIVTMAGYEQGWIGSEWLTILALALSVSFVLGAIFNALSDRLYAQMSSRIRQFEVSKRLPEDEKVDIEEAEIIILGMGRLGSSIYDTLSAETDKTIIGIDYNSEVIEKHLAEGRKVIFGGAGDLEFWQRIPDVSSIKLAVLAMANHPTHLKVVELLNIIEPQINIAGLSRYEDEINDFKIAGIKTVYNLYNEAGRGYAMHILEELDSLIIRKKADE